MLAREEQLHVLNIFLGRWFNTKDLVYLASCISTCSRENWCTFPPSVLQMQQLVNLFMLKLTFIAP